MGIDILFPERKKKKKTKNKKKTQENKKTNPAI
jgi:hypothetical protein